MDFAAWAAPAYVALVVWLGGEALRADLVSALEGVGHVLAAIMIWIGGETGRVVLAGAAGGLMRWWHQETRHLMDGAISVTGGVIFAMYLPPFILAFFSLFGWDIGVSPEAAGSTAFVAGLVGMSFSKFLIAYSEVKMQSMLARNSERTRDEE